MARSRTYFGDFQCTETFQRFERINDDEDLREQMKITDLIQEFLEQIFMYLDFASIVRAADVCTQFRKATKLPFKQKYARNLVELAITPKSSELYHEKHGHVTVTNLKVGMSTLRCFGDSITQLQVINPNLMSYQDARIKHLMREIRAHTENLEFKEPPPDKTFKLYWERKIANVLLYANEYCHESLIKLSMDPPIGLEELRKPFSNVEHVCFSSYFPHTCKRHCLNANFPKLRSLASGTNWRNSASVYADEPLPKLKEFAYIYSASWEKNDHLVPALQKNQQLQKFTIKICEFCFLMFLEECVPHLQSIQEFVIIYKLEPSVLEFANAFSNEGNRIHLANVRIFKLDLDTSYKDRPFPQIPFEFNQLKSFSLEGDFVHSDAFFDFINRNPSITSLFLKNKFIHNFLDKFKLMSAVLLLEEIAILPSDEISMNINFMIDYLRDFDSVNRCMFYCSDPKAYVIGCCGIKWNAQIIPHKNLLTLVKLTRTH